MTSTLLATSSVQENGWIRGPVGPWTATDQHLIRDGLPCSDTPSIVWSGGLGKDPFAANPATWLTHGWHQLQAAVPSEPHPHLLIRPHWAHVLSDAPSCRHACETWGLGLALAPASMLTSGMMQDAAEHLECIFRMCGPLTRVLLLEDLVMQDDLLQPCPAGSGLLSGKEVGQLAREHLDDQVLQVVLADDPEAAAAWLHY